MKANEFIIELKKELKPRNFVAKNAKMGGAGQHKDKKKSEKQGDFKHKQKTVPMENALSELSTEKLAQYKKAAYADAKKADADGDYARGDKRFKGINKATNKQFDNDLKKHGQQGVAEGGLAELANTSLKVKEPKDFVNVNDRKQVVYKVMKFKSGKDTYLINFKVQKSPTSGKMKNWNAVNVGFGVKEKQDDWSFGDEVNTDLTAKNKNQFMIYSTVINAVRKFITEYNTEIDEIIMQGAGERQEAMYQRFFQVAPKYFPGWHHNGKHSLVRDVPRPTGKKVREQDVAEAIT